MATPAEGWTVAFQIAHLHWTDQQALLAATDPEAFAAGLTAAGDRWDAVDAAAASVPRPPEQWSSGGGTGRTGWRRRSAMSRRG